MKPDAISVVEAAYDCASETEAWFERIREEVAPGIDRGFGVFVSTYERGMRPDAAVFRGAVPNPRIVEACNAMIVAYPEMFHQALTSAGPYDLATHVPGLPEPHASVSSAFATYLRPWGVNDIVGLVARDPSGHAIYLAAPSPDHCRPSPREQAKWSRVATHIVAGGRLRRGLQQLKSHDLADGAEAILSPSGAIAHAEAPAQSKGARESLRHAAKSIDRARTKARSDDNEALELWQGLVAGRWSLVDRFDSDGRRYLVARRNAPDVKDPRALTTRERHVLAYAAMGQSLKLIAYSLGLSLSTVSVNRRTAMRKLRLQSHADIVALFAPAAPDVSRGR
jgi:DNA-binding CsgD family transcriptional regulator